MIVQRLGAWLASGALVFAGLKSVEGVVLERSGSVEALQPWVAGVALVLAFEVLKRIVPVERGR